MRIFNLAEELEKERKKNKELEEENKRLKNGYCKLKVKCNNGKCDCTNEEYESMVQANIKGFLLLDDLQDRIDKAIEYIESDYNRNEEVIDYCGFDTFYENLLNILKGE